MTTRRTEVIQPTHHLPFTMWRSLTTAVLLCGEALAFSSPRLGFRRAPLLRRGAISAMAEVVDAEEVLVSDAPKPHVAVVGGGWGGWGAAKSLAEAGCKVGAD